jgi:hypothetical protein
MDFARLRGIKARHEIVIDDSWLRRERARFATGEYERVPFYLDDWFFRIEQVADRFPHVAKKDPTKIAFTESAEKGMRDIQTVISPGRYLERFYGASLRQQTIRDLARAYVTRLATPAFKIARMSDEIVRVYRKGPGSCMSKDVIYYEGDEHPVSVYGLEPGQSLDDIPHALTLAYLEIEERITARALINERDKVFMRLYGDTELLWKSLLASGYNSGNPHGYTVRSISSDRGDYVMPYIDAGKSSAYGAANVSRREDRFVIVKGYGDQAGRTDGVLNEPESDEDADQNYCERSHELTSEDLYEVIINDSGRTSYWSESAVADYATRINGCYYCDSLVAQDGHGADFVVRGGTHSYCELTDDYWPLDEMRCCEVTDDYFHESGMTEIKTDGASVFVHPERADEISFTCLIDGERWHNDRRHADYVGVADIHAPTQDEIDRLGLLPVNHYPHPDQAELALSEAA